MAPDGTKLDALARALGRTASRRAALSAVLVGAVVALRRPTEVGAERPGRKDVREQGKQTRAQPPRADQCDVCDKGCPFSGVQAAIDAANPGATVRICAGTYKSNPSLSINKALTLVGDGAARTVLKGGGFVRVLLIGPSGVVTLQNLTVTNGLELQQQRQGGAGILVLDRGALTLQGCRVEANKARDGGGIAVSRGATLTLLDSVVSQNKALAGGGGLLVRAGGTATLGAGSRVTDNDCTVFGGGISLAGGAITLKSGSSVDDNNAAFNGGGIDAERGSTVTLEAGSRVTGNDAGQRGGGIFSSHATVTVADSSIVTDNDPNNCAVISGDPIANCVN
jgi:hypothetical protein